MSKRNGTACLAGGLMLVCYGAAFAVQPLEITEAFTQAADPDNQVAVPHEHLMVMGNNFNNGGDIELTLGGFPLTVISQTDSEVVAELPEIIGPGSYQLTLTTGGGTVRHDDFDGVTIGAAGPPGADGQDGANCYDGIGSSVADCIGPKGDKGDQGDQGIQGPKGDTGPIGPQGEQGPKGDKGETGAAGANGLNGVDGQDGANCYDGIGTSVADCIGPRGPKGDKGDKGDQGDPGPAGTLTNVYQLRGSGINVNPDTVGSVFIGCDAGDTLISGGFVVEAGMEVRSSMAWPKIDNSIGQVVGTVWRVSSYNAASTARPHRAFLSCADTAPGSPDRSFTLINDVDCDGNSRCNFSSN